MFEELAGGWRSSRTKAVRMKRLLSDVNEDAAMRLSLHTEVDYEALLKVLGRRDVLHVGCYNWGKLFW